MNTYDFNGQVAVVTGGCNGIGAAIAERLVLSGAKLAVWDLDIADVEAKIHALPEGSVRLIEVDVSDEASVRAGFEATLDAFGKVDVLVNSAGIAGSTNSIAGKEGNPNASAYSASKAGVIALTKSLGKELAGQNIAVNCVTPATADTRILDQMSSEFIDYMLSKIPRERFVTVDEIASMVLWMASGENSFTTGAAFDLSGGRATY